MSMWGIKAIPQRDPITIECDTFSISSVWSALDKTFGAEGKIIVVTGDDASTLEAMHLATGKDESPYKHLWHLLSDHSELHLSNY